MFTVHSEFIGFREALVAFRLGVGSTVGGCIDLCRSTVRVDVPALVSVYVLALVLAKLCCHRS